VTDPAKKLEPSVSQAFVESILDYAIFQLDRSGRIVTWNRGAELIKGWKAHEIIGRHFSIFYPRVDIDAGKPERELEEAIANGRVEDQGWRVRKDGTLFWADVVITALHDARGDVYGFAKVTRDLTARRAAEQDARRLAVERAARSVAEAAARRLRFLADASRLFASARLDLQQTLEAIAGHCTRNLGTMCAVELTTGARIFEVRAFALRDPDEDAPDMIAFIEKHPCCQAFSVPLHARGGVIGALTIARREQDAPYTDDDISLLEDTADRAGLAVTNARLFESEVSLRQISEAVADRILRLQTTTADLAGVMTPEEAGAATLRQAVEHFGAAAGLVYLLDDAGENLRAFSRLHVGGWRMEKFETVPMSASLPVTDAVKGGVPTYFERRGDLLARYPALEATDVGIAQATLTVPLLGDAVRGALVLVFPEDRPFSPEDRALAEAIAQQCTQALERTRLLDGARVFAERAQLLAEASEIFASSLNPDVTMSRLAEITVPRLADWCSIDLATPEGETYQAAVAHVDPEKVRWAKRLRETYPPRETDRGVLKVIRTGVPELFSEVSPDLGRNENERRLLGELGLRSAVVVPIGSPKALGAITLCWAETPRHYDRSDLSFVMDLAHRAAIAMENGQLYRALEDAIRVRDDFLAVAGHELKTPLAALTLQLQSVEMLFARSAEPARIRERMQKVARSVERLGVLIHQMLDVARIAHGRLRVQPERMNLSEMVVDVIEHYCDVANGCVIDSAIEPDVYGTWERLRIEQVVTNLLANAIKYGEGKPIAVRLAREGDDAVLVVVDHGIGIAREQQARIFDRFERAVSSRDFGGFGLGLWIAREIIEAHGGSISVTSEPGRGSTFRVRLPLSGLERR
jgi:PAS domain S-box-containing protein